MRYAPPVTRSLLALSAALAACTPPPAAPAQPTANAAAEPRAEDVLYECQKAQGDIAVSFAPGVKLSDLVTWAEAFTCKRFVFRSCLGDARLTIAAPKSMSAPEAWDLFVSSAESVGLTVKLRGDTIALAGDVPCPPPPVVARPFERPHIDRPAVDVDGRINRVDDFTYEIERSLLDELLANPAKMARGARVVPSIKNGKPAGFKLYAIRPTSIYARIGLRNGDTITAVNGIDLTTPDKALEVYEKVKTASTVAVSITRRGKQIRLLYHLH